MSTRIKTRFFRYAALLVGAFLFTPACSPERHSQNIDSQTNWLKSCRIDAQCDSDATCVCGVCTNACTEDAICSKRAGTSCVGAAEPGLIAQCSGTRAPAAGLCLPRCDDSACANNQMCVAGVCTPVPTPSAHVTVDTRFPHQKLTGFGASVAYSEDEITSHPQKAALVSTIFGELGLDVLRLRNRYGHTGDDNIAATSDLVAAATASLGRAPTLFMTSWSPPASLKANGAVNCSGNPGTCTLVKTAGAYDYAGFAAFWRSSLDAYAAVGIVPDYVGIQNNPNWLPTSAELGEACVFLPTEGTTSVAINGVNVNVAYPGFAEALSATLDAFSGLATTPKILAPETSDFASVKDYIDKLDVSSLSAFAHHLYGVDPTDVDQTGLASVGALASRNDKPVFQTEMQADGLGTAMLIHYTTVVEGASAYLQSTLASSATGPATNPQALVALTASAFTRNEPYYSLRHFALDTDPGWVRVDANSSAQDLLASAWLSPQGDALTLVLVNAGPNDVDTELNLDDRMAASRVTRTVFGGIERAAELGSLSDEGIVHVPGRSVVTVAFSE